MTEEISKRLLAWYDLNRRDLPWRHAQNAYSIWVSETMLQQTRVDTVIPYFRRFMALFPTLTALAQADEADVLKAWEGLGYYRRARNLQAGARQVMAEFGGSLPADSAQLLKIHGIGPYTAGAIAAIAFDLPVAAVDGNVIRVVSRSAGVREDVAIPSVGRRIAAIAGDWVPEKRAGDFAQAMMDLGATVCVPGTPNCDVCPLNGLCSAKDEGDPELLPIKAKKSPPREIAYDVVLVQRGDTLLLHQRTETLLGGMWVFPLLEGKHTPSQLIKALKRSTGIAGVYEKDVGEAVHVFTHQVWKMRVHWVRWIGGEPQAGDGFFSASDMHELPMPTAMRKARQIAEQEMVGVTEASRNLTI